MNAAVPRSSSFRTARPPGMMEHVHPDETGEDALEVVYREDGSSEFDYEIRLISRRKYPEQSKIVSRKEVVSVFRRALEVKMFYLARFQSARLERR